jgi:hypothetical protein
LFAFSSSQADIKYITQLNIRAKTQATATKSIASETTLIRKANGVLPAQPVDPGKPTFSGNLGISPEYANSVSKTKTRGVTIFLNIYLSNII